MKKKKPISKKKKPKKAVPSVFIYAPDESLKKKLGIGKKLSEIITPSTVKKVTKKTQKITTQQSHTHTSDNITVKKKPNSKNTKK